MSSRINSIASLETVNFDVEAVRRDFPILDQQVNGRPLAYLDNGATTQKPLGVINAVDYYYRNDNANVHRAAHALSDRATHAFEQARTRVAQFINSPSAEQVVWTRGTTEAINLVAATWGVANLKKGDRILVSVMEHHSNIVPWQLLAERVNAEVIPVPVSAKGELETGALTELLDERVKMVAIGHVSNALGTVNPVQEIVRLAHAVGAKVLVDGAQGPSHLDVDVQELGCDFYAFSGHKMFGPTGIGVLWGKQALLEAMPPYQGGGEMIEHVSFKGTTFNSVPFRFEAGTPNIAGVVGLGAAVDYLSELDREAAFAHEHKVLSYAFERASGIEGLKRVGMAQHQVGIFSFLIDGVHPSDLGMLLDKQGIAVRTGHHCTQPLMEFFNIPGTVRASFAFYNTTDEVDRLFEGLEKAREL
ncbi:MAG: cysteine desulfurase, partial [Gammaproteobacteria bacterium]